MGQQGPEPGVGAIDRESARSPKQPEWFLRWFFVLWIVFVYLWSLTTPTLHQLRDSWGALTLFTLMLSLIGLLIWLSLVGFWRAWQYGLCTLAQAVLVVSSGLLLHQATIVLSLSLALLLSAVQVIRRTAILLALALGYLGLFLVSIPLDAVFDPAHLGAGLNKGVTHWGDFWDMFWVTSGYPTLILFVAGYLALYLQQRRAHAALATAHRQLAASAARIEALTRFAERQRMARDLHDTLVQGVAGIHMRLEAATVQLAQQHLETVQTILQETMATTRTTLAESRSAIDDLRSGSAANDVAMHIREEVARFEYLTGLLCQCQCAIARPISTPVAETVSWVVRESLTNVARHAGAHQVVVRCFRDAGGSLVSEIQDDGMGFDPTTVSTGHYGLLGLRERARLLSGTIEVHSGPGMGTLVRLTLPLAEGGSEDAAPTNPDRDRG